MDEIIHERASSLGYNHLQKLFVSSPINLANKAISNTLANTKLTIALNLMRILREGPLVSFNGSPTVSPITAAACSSVFFAGFLMHEKGTLTNLSLEISTWIGLSIRSSSYPASIIFFALSQAPPVLLLAIAI